VYLALVEIPLPEELQETFVFSAGITTSASDVKAAQAFIEFLRSPEARAVIKAMGWSQLDELMAPKSV
jgi:ABC-type molybdate transport system substrate-binding protein